jgi:hypothetical protein
MDVVMNPYCRWQKGLRQLDGRKPAIIIAVAICTIFVCIFLAGCSTVSYEEPEYSVIKKEADIELRRYRQQLVAEATVEGDFKEAGNRGFRLLFDYISGKNKSRESIEMTAPVSQEARPEKIEMTVPVNQERTDGGWHITFFMPSKYTLENIPEPLDPSVRIKEVPSRLMAVLMYSGTWSQKRYESKRQELYRLLTAYDINPVGEPILARYNSPFTPWFLRRNEVVVEVEDKNM